MSTPSDFSDKVIIVTGPGGNLGSAVIKRFKPENPSFVLLDRHSERLNQRFPELAKTTGHLLIPDIDLVNQESVHAAIQKAINTFGHIDCVIHTAGGFQMGEQVHEITAESWNHMMDLNVKTLLNISRSVIPQMIHQQSGKIITIGARPSFSGKARMGAYSAAKTAVLRLTESMSAELKSKGINVNCVIPGTIDTPDNRQAMPDADTSRWVSPESLADVIYFLCSRAANDIHGSAIPVYGK